MQFSTIISVTLALFASAAFAHMETITQIDMLKPSPPPQSELNIEDKRAQVTAVPNAA